MLFFFAFAGILLVSPWAALLPEKFQNWEQITIIRSAVLLLALLRLAVTTARKKLTYRLYCLNFIIFLFIWLCTQLMLQPYQQITVKSAAKEVKSTEVQSDAVKNQAK